MIDIDTRSALLGSLWTYVGIAIALALKWLSKPWPASPPNPEPTAKDPQKGSQCPDAPLPTETEYERWRELVRRINQMTDERYPRVDNFEKERAAANAPPSTPSPIRIVEDNSDTSSGRKP